MRIAAWHLVQSLYKLIYNKSTLNYTKERLVFSHDNTNHIIVYQDEPFNDAKLKIRKILVTIGIEEHSILVEIVPFYKISFCRCSIGRIQANQYAIDFFKGTHDANGNILCNNFCGWDEWVQSQQEI